jgi:hypothetical protein
MILKAEIRANGKMIFERTVLLVLVLVLTSIYRCAPMGLG